MVAAADVKIDIDIIPMDAMTVEFLRDPDDCKSRAEIDSYTRIILPDGRRCRVSGRFWNSWCSLQNQGRSVFDLFSHAEVFSRIQKNRGDKVRIAVESADTPDGGKINNSKLISCTNPTKPLLPIGEAMNLVHRYEGDRLTYEDGEITATFDCPFPTPYNIAGEDYQTQFTIKMPIDGYGMPLSYLTLLREVCTNGLIGMAKAFKTQFQLGRGENNIAEVLDRAMQTFSAEEGFHSFKLRLEAAARSWASLGEASKLYKILGKALHSDSVPIKRRVSIIEKMDEMCGDPLKFYGLTSRQELSARKARTVPVNTTVYELMTFASEVATHEVESPKAKNQLNAWIGDAISTEYDLEGTMEEFREWQDFFVREDPETISVN